MDVYVNNRQINLGRPVGKGGEADVFDMGNNKAIKIFKPPDHLDYSLSPEEQDGARARIAEHQTKLPLFPKNLSPQIIAPIDLANDKNGKIIGYTMRLINGAEALLRFTEKSFRELGVSNTDVNKIFLNLHSAVSKLHKKKVVIGDFNDLNVLVKGTEIYIIDADSFQFGQFLCKMFTMKFLDPLLSENNNMVLKKPYRPESDWYAFSAMLMECFLFAGPYGGVYIPKNKSEQIPRDKRPLKRITIFNPDVRYPKPAARFDVLPDDLLHYFHLVFEKDRREQFPASLLQNLRWTQCEQCGTEHSRNICPNCAYIAPAAIQTITIIRGKVTATRIFKTYGQILFAAAQNEELHWLYYENKQFKRENGQVIIQGELNPFMRFRIQGESTLIAQNNKLLTFRNGKNPETLAVDCYGNLPIFDANKSSRYWMYQGQLLRDGTYGQEYIGDALSGQTLFWAGPKFGFGFYRAGNISVAFVFDAKARGIKDDVVITFKGQLVDSTCVFTKHYGWFFASTQEAGKTINRCYLINEKGDVLAKTEGEERDGTWLSNIRGKYATDNFLFSATDAGIVRIEMDNGKLIKTREFPDTEPFVNSGSHLFAGKEGLYVVDKKEIRVLKIN